jgi:hypothetical protein
MIKETSIHLEVCILTNDYYKYNETRKLIGDTMLIGVSEDRTLVMGLGLQNLASVLVHLQFGCTVVVHTSMLGINE